MIDKLPKDIIIYISKYLDQKSFIYLYSTNKFISSQIKKEKVKRYNSIQFTIFYHSIIVKNLKNKNIKIRKYFFNELKTKALHRILNKYGVNILRDINSENSIIYDYDHYNFYYMFNFSEFIIMLIISITIIYFFDIVCLILLLIFLK